MRRLALMALCGTFAVCAVAAPESRRAPRVDSPSWASSQYAEARATQDPVARRLLLEHLLDALDERDVLWLRVRGQLMVLAYWEKR